MKMLSKELNCSSDGAQTRLGLQFGVDGVK